MPKITLVNAAPFGGEYLGNDTANNNETVHLVEGETQEVSQEKADQLLEHFGELFKLAAGSTRRKPAPKA